MSEGHVTVGEKHAQHRDPISPGAPEIPPGWTLLSDNKAQVWLTETGDIRRIRRLPTPKEAAAFHARVSALIGFPGIAPIDEVEHIPGTREVTIRQPRGETVSDGADQELMGEVLGRLHAADPPETTADGEAVFRDRITRRYAEADPPDPVRRRLDPIIRDGLGALDELSRTTMRRALVHGDAHHGNLVRVPGHDWGLVDLDSAGMGAVELDVGMMVRASRYGVPRERGVAALEAYRRVSGLDPDLDGVVLGFLVREADVLVAMAHRAYGRGRPVCAGVAEELDWVLAHAVPPTVTSVFDPPARPWRSRWFPSGG